MWFRSTLLLSVLILGTGCTELAVNANPEKGSADAAQVPLIAPASPPVSPAAKTTEAPPANQADLPCIETTHGCISENPDVTQETIERTICVSGYTKTVRPSTSYTKGVKRKLLREAGIDESLTGQYELDHIIPLAVGGHPRKLSNLMLQPWYGEKGAHKKDGLERRLQGMVCRGDLSLLDAQRCIAEDWVACDAELSGR
jgi:hypothetical protein